jgi:hypothetical protein
MTREEADTPTSPTTPLAPASSARGGLAVLESVAGGEVIPLPSVVSGGVAVPASSTNDYATTLVSGDLMWEGET